LHSGKVRNSALAKKIGQIINFAPLSSYCEVFLISKRSRAHPLDNNTVFYRQIYNALIKLNKIGYMA